MAVLTVETGSGKAGAPPWKCPHGVYSPTGRAEYCLSCTPEGPPDEDDSEQPFVFRTCSACWKTKPIEQFHANPRTGAPYQNCLECPGPRVPNPNHEDRAKEYSLRRRHGAGNLSTKAWLQKCERAGWLCSFCECALTPETVICGRWIPANRGGTNDVENGFPACKPCHGRFAASWRVHGDRLAA